MSFMSSSKASELLTAIQLNPEILTNDSAFLTDTIQRAARWLVQEIGIDRYPDLSQGDSVSGASPSEDISSESDNELMVSIDNESFNTVELTLGSLTSGAAIATALQVAIRAVSNEAAWRFVTVVFTDVYTITSPTFGEVSAVNVSASSGHEDLAVALKLSPEYGGTEFAGSTAIQEYDDMVMRLVNHWYNQVGVEGMKSHSVSGGGSYSEHDIDPHVMKFIANNRRVIQ
jgi:hypothetical protein